MEQIKAEETNIYKIMEEFRKLDRGAIMKKVSAHIVDMVENRSPKDVAYVLAYSTAMYSLFDGILEKLTILESLDSLLKKIDEVILQDSEVKLDKKDIN